jgi:hypothetical protein
MSKLLYAAALAAGIWLIYLGLERQHSLAGNADSTFATLGQRIDGGAHPTTHMKYYVAGAALTVVGVVGLGIVKK